MENIKKGRFLALALAALGLSSWADNASAKSGIECYICKDVDILLNTPRSVDRSERFLILILGAEDRKLKLTDKDIDALILSLKSDDSSIVYWAAVGLGNVGPRAKRALPVLQSLLPEAELEDCEMPVPVSLESGIRYGIEGITGFELPVHDCAH